MAGDLPVPDDLKHLLEKREREQRREAERRKKAHLDQGDPAADPEPGENRRVRERRQRRRRDEDA